MFFISFKSLCRKCLYSNPVVQMINITGGDITEYQEKTDFEIMQEVNGYKLETRCLRCHSDNLQFYEFEVDNRKLFDFERISKDQELHFFALQIEKLFIDDFKAEISGKQAEKTPFLIACLRDSLDCCINTIPNENFYDHNTGYFSIIYTGEEDSKNGGYILQIEKLIHYGISKEELKENINHKISTLLFSSF